jgi:chromosome partitioning protein
MKTRIITFANRKGGSGKTSTVVNLAATLGKKEKKCLVIDLDPQSHATLISGINPYNNIKKDCEILHNGGGTISFFNYHPLSQAF